MSTVGLLETMAPEDLASVREIADLFGVSRQTALRYTRHEAFPQPLGRVAAGPIWRLSDVQAWGAAHLPLPRPGRPRKTA
jgi:eukaryotic-like serine/threonine-protein kinase